MSYVLIAALAVLLSDQLTKYYVRQDSGLPRLVCRGRLRLLIYHNYGFALGRARQHPRLVRALVTLCLAALVIIIAAGGYVQWLPPLADVALGLLLGGGFGNLADRYRQGYVLDWFSFPQLPRAWSRLIFNLADLAIFAGVLLMALSACW